MVERIIAALEVPRADVSVIATGYLADLVIGVCTCFTDHRAQLTLQGLEMVFRRNS